MSAGFSKKRPDSISSSIRGSSCSTRYPAPRLRCPTSELPICPSGSPTASPDAASVLCGAEAQRRSITGVSARAMALPGPGGAIPQPSRMIRTQGRMGMRSR